jgi:hypothetical protein
MDTTGVVRGDLQFPTRATSSRFGFAGDPRLQHQQRRSGIVDEPKGAEIGWADHPVALERAEAPPPPVQTTYRRASDARLSDTARGLVSAKN